MKRLIVAGGLIATAGCNAAADKPIDPAAAAAQPAPIARTDRKAATAEPAGYIGVLTPREATEVTAPFTSKVDKLYVNLGDEVAVGQPLALLDDRPLREELAIAKAQYKEARIAAGAAASTYARERLMFKQGVTSKAAVSASGFESGKAGASVEQHKARIEQLEQRLVDTTLKATIAGKVALRYVEETARVTEGQPVLRVISSDELFVKFAIPAADARKLAPGDTIEVRFEGKSIVAEGVVKSVAPELDPVAQMILAEAEIQDLTAELQPGLVCRIVAKPKPAASSAPPAAAPSPSPTPVPDAVVEDKRVPTATEPPVRRKSSRKR